VHYSPDEFPQVRSSSIREDCRRTLASRGNILIPRTALSVSIHDSSQDGPPEGFFVSRGMNSRDELPVSERRTIVNRRNQGGTSLTFGTRRMHQRADDEKKRDRGRERKREKRQREGSAREFAGRLKHGSTVSRPRTRNSTRLRRTSPPSPSALPRGQGGCSGAQRVGRGECGAPAPGESADGGIRCTRYLPLGTLSFCGA